MATIFQSWVSLVTKGSWRWGWGMCETRWPCQPWARVGVRRHKNTGLCAQGSLAGKSQNIRYSHSDRR